MMRGTRIRTVDRRAKYLLLGTDVGTLILHLGMSGSLRVVAASNPAGKHDHFEIVFTDGNCLRLRDPRRFGCVLWTTKDPARHPLLNTLGPEPLSRALSGGYLYAHSRDRRISVKSYIMNADIVAGIGNIYANEALFAAGIHPQRRAGRISLQRYTRLADSIKTTLRRAIHAGGTTLRDFSREDGNPGYFQQQLRVYGREGASCARCQTPIRRRMVAQRSSYFCPRCQR
jgi:formamidopyrimidine-DNA glycosylase